MNRAAQMAKEELLGQAIGLDYPILHEDYFRSVADAQVMRVVVQMKEDDIEDFSFGIIFALASCSFSEARPSDESRMHFREADELTILDFLKHLSFECNKLHFNADYLRGRLVKTDITISSDGLMLLETRNRGKSASRWLRTLPYKKVESSLAGGRNNLLFAVKN